MPAISTAKPYYQQFVWGDRESVRKKCGRTSIAKIVLNDVQHSCHLRKHQNFVSSTTTTTTNFIYPRVYKKHLLCNTEITGVPEITSERVMRTRTRTLIVLILHIGQRLTSRSNRLLYLRITRKYRKTLS